ncbi:hypothetical protein BH20ACT4_BH20ACT4_09590 [soil metagenome]
MLARSRAALISGDLGQAIDGSAAATAAWADIGAPFEMARARMVLGEAHHSSGDIDRARMEWQAARAAFEAFGAVQWAERAESLVAEAVPSATSSPTRRAAKATLRCDGDTRTICFEGVTVLMGDLGFRYVERLVADPGREFHVLDLAAVENGSLPTGRTGGQGVDAAFEGIGGGPPVIDDEARDA